MLHLPDGMPAANAEILAVPNDLSDAVLWQSSTADDGSTEVPHRLDGAILLIKHANAASLARMWHAADVHRARTWQLSNAAAPLNVQVIDTSQHPARFAHVVVWIDGIPLRGRALRFLAGAAAVTDRDGYWRAMSLGGQTYAILALREFRTQVPQSLAQTIAIPGTSDVSVRVVE